MTKFGIVGSGRVGGAIGAALVSRCADSLTLSSRTCQSANNLAFGLQAAFGADCRVATASDVVAASDIVFLCTPDSIIDEVSAQLPWSAGQLAVHTSGARGLEVLQVAAAAGAATASFHPLNTFATKVCDARTAAEARERLGESWIAISSGSSRAAELLGGLAVDHCQGAFSVPEAVRPLYHAMAVFSSNYIVALVAAASRLWKELGIAEDEGLRFAEPLLRRAMASLLTLGPQKALTGPVARGDLSTVEIHMNALAGSEGAESLLPLYVNLAEVCGRLARDRGSIDGTIQAQLESLLRARSSRSNGEATAVREMLKSKIHRATVTGAELHYEGSITLDRTLMDLAGIYPYEKVHVVDVNNGARFETYVIEGGRGSGTICVNGAAARLVQPGDTVIVISYKLMSDVEARAYEPTIVHVDSSNMPIQK